MQQWYTQELCRLTGVSARTLRHYDVVGLLKASTRLSNGYRVYSEADLARLQQILALKSFGFELSQIKEVLSGQTDVLQLLQMQKDFLEQKTQQFKEAIDILAAVIDDSKMAGSVDTSSIVKLIKGNKTMKELEQSILAKIFTQDQLKRFAKMPEYTDEEMEAYGRKWDVLITKVQEHLSDDPYGPTGQMCAKKWMDLAYEYWKDDDLIGIVWDCYKNDRFPKNEPKIKPIPQDVIQWIDKAVGFMQTGHRK